MTTSQKASAMKVHPQTIRRWTKTGKLDCTRTIGNHRRFEPPMNDSKLVIGYARVSSFDQKEDLVRQQEYIRTQHKVDQIIQDTGSGMNYKKPGFKKLMLLILEGKVKELVITHKDRLLRFGSEIIFIICKFFGVTVTILHDEKPKDSKDTFASDVIEIITVFCSRIYGQRSHQNRNRIPKCSTSPSILPAV